MAIRPPVTAMEVHSVYQVFTPTSHARLNYVPRDTVTDDIVDVLRTPGKQLVLYGESGSGKSTLLVRMLEQTYPAHITTQCSIMTTFDQVLLNTFDQLDAFYTESQGRTRERQLSATLGADFSRIRSSIAAASKDVYTATSKRLVPPQLTPQRLAQFLGELGVCWVIEDFHKIESSEKPALSQSLKIFSDLGAEYPDAKVVVVGASQTARQVVEYDREMNRRVAEIGVPLMTPDEISQILLNGEVLLNVEFREVVASVVRYSMGVPSVAHQLALNACVENHLVATSREVVRFGNRDLDLAVARYIRDSSDSLKFAFEEALKTHKIRRYDNCRLVLAALARGPLNGLRPSDILAEIRRVETDYPSGNLARYLRLLEGAGRGGLVVAVDGRYRFSDPLYHTFAQIALVGTRVMSSPDTSIESGLPRDFWGEVQEPKIALSWESKLSSGAPPAGRNEPPGK